MADVPDKVRTEIVKALVQLRPRILSTDALKADLANFVKSAINEHANSKEQSRGDHSTMELGEFLRWCRKSSPAKYTAYLADRGFT